MPETGPVAALFPSRTQYQAALAAVAVGVYSLLPVWKEMSGFRNVADIPAEIHAAFTIVIGWLVVFRMNVAYNRWWEARTLWGGLVNCSRNLATKLTMLVRLPEAELARAARDLTAFPCALRDHLREGAVLQRLAGYEKATEQPVHVPAYLVGERYAALQRWKSAGLVDGFELRVIDQELSRYLEIAGGCERIRQGYMARTHRNFARQCLTLFFLTLPWGIVNEFGVWTILLTAITAYFLLGLELVAERAEEPFGTDEIDIDLDAICGSIERSVGEITRQSLSSSSSAGD